MIKAEKITAKDKLLLAATELFPAAGIVATGIDSIIKKAAVAKGSLYDNFNGKDALIIAYLQEQEKLYISLLECAENKNGSAFEKVISLIEAIEKELLAKNNYLVAHINALAEFRNPEHIVYKEALAFKKRLFEKLKFILASETFADVEKLVAQLLLIIDGACMGATYGLPVTIRELVQVILTNANLHQPPANQNSIDKIEAVSLSRQNGLSNIKPVTKSKKQSHVIDSDVSVQQIQNKDNTSIDKQQQQVPLQAKETPTEENTALIDIEPATPCRYTFSINSLYFFEEEIANMPTDKELGQIAAIVEDMTKSGLLR